MASSFVSGQYVLVSPGIWYYVSHNITNLHVNDFSIQCQQTVVNKRLDLLVPGLTHGFVLSKINKHKSHVRCDYVSMIPFTVNTGDPIDYSINNFYTVVNRKWSAYLLFSSIHYVTLWFPN